jgi:hypothetical protein
LTPQKLLSHQANLADLPQYAEKWKEMEALPLNEMVQHDDAFRLWDQPPAKREIRQDHAAVREAENRHDCRNVSSQQNILH